MDALEEQLKTSISLKSSSESYKKSATFLEKAQAEERLRFLDQRSRKLVSRLAIRPFDRRAIEELVEVTYENGDYNVCMDNIQKAVKLGLGAAGTLHVKLGKSCFRNWYKERKRSGWWLSQFCKLYVMCDIHRC